ncbi:Jag N-terminal domain-containing protein [Bacillus coahuilensis]|uniref:Jag N-terminal domain-containing protein n=1 Tax=Bacillus coahuilensis TaxID=408580 RepID=UPI0001850790|nr:Jag N-terminal domain-containing protein [Bacillus coahuilensis]
MNSVTATGNTIDEAIASGLAQLHIEEKQAEITVVEEGKKGFFGLFGHKPFIVKVEKKERLAELVVDYLHGIMKELGVEGTTHIEETPGNMVISLTTNESKGLLAKNGQALYAVEQLLQAKINHHSERFMTCEFDVNRWKENRRKK